MLRIRRLSATRRFSATSAVKYTGGSLVVAATVFGAAAFTASRDKQLGKLWVDIVPYGAAILKHISIAEQAALDAREQTAEVIGAAREYLEHGVQKVVDAKDTVLESSQKAHKKASELLEGAQTVAKHTQEDVAGLINVSKRTVDDVLEKLSLKEKKDDGVSKISKPAARDLPTLKTDPKLPVKEAPPIEPKLQVTAQSLPKPAEIAAPIISFVEIETPTTAGKESNKVIIAEVPAQTALISDEHKTIDSSNTQAVDIKPHIESAPKTAVASSDKEQSNDALFDFNTISLIPAPEQPAVSTLRNSIDSLVLALHKIQLGPENAKVNVIENVRDTLIGLTTIIDALEADEVSTMQHALHEQAVVFTDILSDFMQDSMHLLDDQKRELGTNLKERELKFVEQVEHQQLEFTQTLAAKLTEQEKKLNSTWRATVKERVDQERAGRLAKLDMLAIKMQQIENASSQAGIYILRAHRIHSLMTNIAAFQRSLTVGAKTDYSHELQVVQKIAVDDAFVQFLLDTVSPVGVVSKGALIGEFNGLEPEIRKVQLMPDQAGPISYFLSKWLSYLFIPKSGLVAGQDVESTISRAKYYLMNSDLDSAAREINQLDGWCGFIVREWLVKARKHLEVEQALDAIETHVHLQSLGMAK